MKLQLQGRIRYPDAFAVCTPVPRDAKVVTEPVVVFEILSDSTSISDLVFKNAEYQATPSIQRYVVLQQSEPAAVVFVRRGQEWASESLVGVETELRLPEIGIAVPLAELYADIPD